MKSMRSILPATALLLACMASPAWAVKPFVADYEATVKGVIHADAQMKLTSAGGNRWNYELSVNNPIASVRQTTVFEDRDGTWRPLSGNDSTQMLIKKSQKNASYDWIAGEARWSGDVKPDRMGPVKLQAGDVDAMMLNLVIVRDVAAGKSLSYRMVDNGLARQQTYQNLGQEKITVAGKPKTATKVSRSSEGKLVTVWVVEGLPVPARILQQDDGKDSLDLVLKSVN
ncbi:DUF3108 domain-containing protein [Thermomonas sp.]|uniref:DUF3108 domain-containing protein n=1 Tax=Thermomonas sp. TaxID=1971895 RepID=UPI0024872F97|nr:DUF3108 domain-containing protein [Thermomonas sp.]MDI1251900.1 DUF3108 domain-containing protein [Thermomonas sp.]